MLKKDPLKVRKKQENANSIKQAISKLNFKKNMNKLLFFINKLFYYLPFTILINKLTFSYYYKNTTYLFVVTFFLKSTFFNILLFNNNNSSKSSRNCTLFCIHISVNHIYFNNIQIWFPDSYFVNKSCKLSVTYFF